ncbi:MAG: lipoyl synthase [Candidatus Dadabacteria bacterium]|nr:MAG: lipoyl synthase [Candidatus Dadabacteria bacterium]
MEDLQLVTLSRKKGTRIRKPPWLKVRPPGSPGYLETRGIVRANSLNTVCEEARCPNIGECWGNRTATFMIMGDLCTRRCNFCSVKKGTPQTLKPLAPDEPKRVAEAVRQLNLRHVVITSVDRDDLPDCGARHFAHTIKAIREISPDCKIEALIGDLGGLKKNLEIFLRYPPDVLSHNVETVPRLYRKVRPYSGYIRSLSILSCAKEILPSITTKSGLMVGLGEEVEEVISVMDDLRYHKVDVLTIGQYLRPSQSQMPVKKFVTPEQFERYKEEGLKKGFKFVESAPLVRSSYMAWKHAL